MFARFTFLPVIFSAVILEQSAPARFFAPLKNGNAGTQSEGSSGCYTISYVKEDIESLQD